MSDKALTIYEQLVAVTSELLGPASSRFIDRQIDSHLNKKPHELTMDDLDQLTEWIKLSLGLLTKDIDTLHEYSLALKSLKDPS